MHRDEVVGVGDGVPKELPRGDYVRIDVVDTGIGISQATLAKAMEPFFTTKGIGKGTGLGLSMVQGLTAQSGGTLKISSTPGKGTTDQPVASLRASRRHPDRTRKACSKQR